MENKTSKVTSILFALTLVMVIAVVANNFYTFYTQKNYDLLVETSCSEGDLCFIRYCGDCPPNELEQYRLFTLKAYEYESCKGDSCESMCKSGVQQCEEILCDEEVGDTCTLASTIE